MNSTYTLKIVVQGGAVARTIRNIGSFQRAEELADEAKLGNLGVRGADVVDTIIENDHQ